MNTNSNSESIKSIQIDNADTIEFLSTCANIFFDCEAISERNLHELRISLNEFQQSQTTRLQILWEHLIKSNKNFLIILSARFGNIHLSMNILKRSLKPIWIETQTLMCEWAKTLLDKSKLYFNRSITTFCSNEPESQTLYSKLLVDASEGIKSCTYYLSMIEIELSTMHPQVIDNSHSIDLKLCQALGFKEIDTQTFIYAKIHQIRHLWSFSFQILAEICLELCIKIDQTKSTNDAISLEHNCRLLQADAFRLLQLAPPTNDRLIEWEVYRQTICQHLLQLRNVSFHLQKNVINLLNDTLKQKMNVTSPLSKSTIRNLTAELIKQGTQPPLAQNAASDLVKYCLSYQIDPKNLIPSELKKINPLLSSTTNKLLAHYCHDDLNMHLSAQKKQTLEKTEKLQIYFQNCLKSIASLIASFIVLIGCGLKTFPHSDLMDYRPSIPFKDNSIEDSELKNHSQIEKSQNLEKNLNQNDNQGK